jgi:hypothetical protein
MMSLPYKLLAALILALVLLIAGFIAGIKWEKPKRIALEQGYQVAAAQTAGREAERVRQAAARIAHEQEKADARIAQADRSFDAYLGRLRDAYSRSDRVRAATPAPEGCPAPSGPTAADILREGEKLAGIVRDADRDRAALEACVAAWPR